MGNLDFEKLKSCLFEGEIGENRDIPIAVSGCPGSSRYEVQIFSAELNSPMYLVENGNVITLDIPSMDGFNHTLIPREEKKFKKSERFGYSERDVPSSGLR